METRSFRPPGHQRFVSHRCARRNLEATRVAHVDWVRVCVFLYVYRAYRLVQGRFVKCVYDVCVRAREQRSLVSIKTRYDVDNNNNNTTYCNGDALYSVSVYDVRCYVPHIRWYNNVYT